MPSEGVHTGTQFKYHFEGIQGSCGSTLVDKGHNFDEFSVSVLYLSELSEPLVVQWDLLKHKCQWIYKLRAMEPSGLNMNNDFTCFL